MVAVRWSARRDSGAARRFFRQALSPLKVTPAMSVSSLGIRLSNLGRHEEALAPGEEAVAIGRRLAEATPAAYLPDLAGRE